MKGDSRGKTLLSLLISLAYCFLPILSPKKHYIDFVITRSLDSVGSCSDYEIHFYGLDTTQIEAIM